MLHAAISEDDGRTWRGYREVAQNPFIDEPPPPRGDHGVSYTLPALTKEGEIITPLQVGGTGGMWLLRLNPEWLYETSRKTDFSSGAKAGTTSARRELSSCRIPISRERESSNCANRKRIGHRLWRGTFRTE